MGGDGGSIPKRDDLVRNRTKPEHAGRDAQLVAKWKHCAITQQPLQQPIVSCELGRLYSKEAVLEFLLDRSKFECSDQFCHIRGLKDIKELKLTINPAFTTDASKSGRHCSEWNYICPVSGLEMNGRYKFCYFLGCGCVFSERALREIKDSICVNCGRSYVDDDIITINGSDEEISDLTERMKQRRMLAKSKAKKRKAESSTVATSTETSDPAIVAVVDDGACTSDGGTTKQLADENDVVVARKTARHAPPATSSKHATAAATSSHHKPTIQDDPNASEVFKSLFNTHKTAKMQTKAHWVTYNPQYF